MRNKLANFVFYILGYFPQALPTGTDAFDAYCTRLFGAYSLPDYPSYREAVATMILQMPAPKGQISAPADVAPRKIANAIRKGMVNEVAWNYIQDQKAARLAAKPNLTVASTTPEAGDGPEVSEATS